MVHPSFIFMLDFIINLMSRPRYKCERRECHSLYSGSTILHSLRVPKNYSLNELLFHQNEVLASKREVRASPVAYLIFCTVWTVNSFYLLTFLNTFSNKFFIIFSISFKYYLFIYYLLFF